jgi:hypothetical protein
MGLKKIWRNIKEILKISLSVAQEPQFNIMLAGLLFENVRNIYLVSLLVGINLWVFKIGENRVNKNYTLGEWASLRNHG